MSTTPKDDTLTRIEQQGQNNAETLASHGDLLRMNAERMEQVIKLLTPELKDGPSLDELLKTIISQQTEIIGYNRQIVEAQAQMERTLPGDVARALDPKPGDHAGGHGAMRNGRA